MSTPFNHLDSPTNPTFRLYGDHLTRNFSILESVENLDEDAQKEKASTVIELLGGCFPAGDRRDEKGASQRQLRYIFSLADFDDGDAMKFVKACVKSGGLSMTQAGHLIDVLSDGDVQGGPRGDQDAGFAGFDPHNLTDNMVSFLEAIREAGGDTDFVPRGEVIRVYEFRCYPNGSLNHGAFTRLVRYVQKRGLVSYKAHVVNAAKAELYSPHVRLTKEFACFLRDNDLADSSREQE